MDSDFWTSRLAAAKRQFNLQQHHHHAAHYQRDQLDRLNIDDYEVEEEVRPDFPCPYCYDDFDIISLCSHMEDEHSSESKVTICPICSVKVASDMLAHITLQHRHLFKLQRCRRLRRVAVPSSQAMSLLGRDIREAHIQVLQRGSTYRSNNAPNAISDPLMSSLVLKFPSLEAEDISKSLASAIEDTSTKSSASQQQMWKSRFDPSLSSEEREKRMKQAAVRAVFVQDLLASTLSIS